MDLKIPKPFLICIFIFNFTILASPPPPCSRSVDACSPRNCGELTDIRYPFWIAGSCGHPNFEINCREGKYPVLRLSDEDYIIKGIFYGNSSFLLASAAVYDEKQSCPSPSHDVNLNQAPFHCTSDDTEIFFFYGCPSKPSRCYEIECASNDNNHSFAIFPKELTEYGDEPFKSCRSRVRVPFRRNLSVGDDELANMDYVEILKMGFVLNWTEQTSSDCKRSAKDRTTVKIIIGVSAGVGGLFLTMIFLVIWYKWRRRNGKTSHTVQRGIPLNASDLSYAQEHETGGYNMGVHVFSYKELDEATKHFDSTRELGDGGFGTVYHGLLKDGRAVAVKRLYENNFKRVEQFMNEVKILALVRHPNLVSLYGCTSRDSRELLLVYEYVPNGTVADHLHGTLAKPGKLPWPMRLKIAVETANALVYLHASKIIHRDVKTNNILIDNDYCVKVGDFGLSRLFPLHVTHVSTTPQGTPGYVDPEYHQCYQLTDKSDVFSFGVVLVELISSKPAVDITRHRHEINLFNMFISKIQNRELHELVDPSLGFESDYKTREMITSTAELAFQCLQSVKDLRPSMVEVLETLTNIQKQNSCKERTVIDISGEDAVLLKNGYGTLPVSQSSTSESWVSSSSATTGSISV